MPFSPTTLQRPRASPVLTDIIGLSEAKATLHEAVVLPASLPDPAGRLFWRSAERSAVLLAGPSGLGLEAAAEAAAAAIGAQVLRILALEAASGAFCTIASAAANSTGRPVVVIIESLEAAAEVVSLRVRKCLAAQGGEGPKLFVVATSARDARVLGASALVPFGYVAHLGLPSEAERKQYLLRLFAQISRVDAQWASALREAAVATLANLTAKCTYADIDLLVRRAFLRSTSDEGARDPVALHHFEKILEDFAPRGHDAFLEGPAAPTTPSATPAAAQVQGGDSAKPTSTDNTEPKKKKDVKDPMDGIFGWCNFWLPEALHLSPVVWAMIIFGVLAHFMARSTYQPYNSRRKRGNTGRGGASLWGDLGGGAGGAAGVPGFPSFSDNLSDWYPGGVGGAGGFPGFPQPPGMPRPGEGASSLFADAGAAKAGTTTANNAGDAATGGATQPTPEPAPPAAAVPQEATENNAAEPAEAPDST